MHSTFTPHNDIFLKLRDRFLVFDINGNQIPLVIEEKVKQLRIINDYKLEQCQIVAINQGPKDNEIGGMEFGEGSVVIDI